MSEQEIVEAELTASSRPKKSDSRFVYLGYLVIIIGAFFLFRYIKTAFNAGNPRLASGTVVLNLDFGDHVRQFERQIQRSMSLLEAITEATLGNNIEFSYNKVDSGVTVVQINSYASQNRQMPGYRWRVYLNDSLVPESRVESTMVIGGDKIVLRYGI